MKHALRTFGLVFVMLLVATLKPTAQTATVKGDVLKDWTSMKDTIVKIAREMPEDKYTYKSTPPQRDFGAQVMHIAQANVGVLKSVGGKATPPIIDMKATKKADVIKAMSDSFDYGTALINEQTNQSMLETVQAEFLGPSTRARIFFSLVGHTWDIYGQMAVYLRLNGGVPPASQRP